MVIYELSPRDAVISIPKDIKEYRCLVLIDRAVSPDERERASRKLVESGCLYMMAWGLDCSLWDDAVDQAVLEAFEFREVPDQQFVMTTWHENESLEEVIRFAKFDAILSYANKPLRKLLVLDLGIKDREALIREMYLKA